MIRFTHPSLLFNTKKRAEDAIRFGTKEKFSIFKTIKDFDRYTDKFGVTSWVKAANNAKLQAKAWDNVAISLGYENCSDKKFVDAVLEFVERHTSVNTGFRGLEFLCIVTKDRRLLERSDFYSKKRYTNAMFSYLYGGERLKLMKRYSSINFDTIGAALALKDYLLDMVYIDFSQVSLNRDVIKFTDLKNYSRKAILSLLMHMEVDFDFDIEEPEESSTWTIHVLKGTSDKTSDFGTRGF